ncbi:MAG: hypothetical protein II364_00260, partial [Bacteroidales bacterium]|nr:hypothetical protein [Bacteroidales bacterium]
TEQSPTVFEENSVTTSGQTTRGGALLLAYASSIEVEYTNFIGNYGISTGNYGTEGGAVAFAETSYGSFEHVSFVGTKGAKNAVRNGAHVSMDNTSSPAQATTFKNCSFTKGQASNVAGAIHIREYSKLSLEDCSFANNTTSNFGGALHINNKNAQASFTDCTFSENSTKVYGGALSMEDGTCNFYNCSFTGNVGQYGAISLYFQKNVTVGTANLNIYGCTFQNNSSTLDDNAATLDVQKSGGGAIYAGRGNVFVTSSDGTASGTRTSFTGNSAESGGGAISLIPNNGTVSAEIKYADINQNTASEYGGAIYANTNLSMTDCILDENTATLGASALYVSGNLTVTGSDTTKCAIRNHSESVSGSIIRYSTASALSFSHCKISKNTLSDMTENGGYFPLKGSNSLSMTNCEFSRNTLPASADTKYGGFAALYEGSTASLALTGTKVADCSGCKHGGAIYVKGGKSSDYAVNISGGSFENCSCDAYGGVINFDTPTDVAIKAQVIGTSFTGNSAGYKGGVFHLNGNGNARELLLESCTFSNNTHTGEHTSTGGGGGVINMAGGKLTINSCTFTGNKSLAKIQQADETVGGGVIYVNGTQKAELHIGTDGKRVVFTANEATAYGGAIAIFNSNVESVIDITNAKFKENKSVAWGGGLYVKNQSSLSLYNVGFTENQVTTAQNGGDALFFDGTSFKMDGTGANLNYINDQTSTYPMHTPNVTEYTFNNFDFKRNTSTRDGALLHLDNTVPRGFTITNSCLYGNSAPEKGGVIYADLHQDSRESLIEKTQIDSNQVTSNTGLGGAIYWNCDSWNNNDATPGLKIYGNSYGNSTLCKNKAGKSGSAVYLLKGHLHCEEITMNENTFHTLDSKDDDYGGTIAMCHNMSKVDFNSSVAHNNVSTGKGGVFHIRGGRLFANNIQADNNSANTRGGFIFQTSYVGSEGFVLIQKSSFVGNYLRHSSDVWGKFSHANSNNNGMHAMMISRCTIDDGSTSRPGAVINGAPNLLLLGTTVYANSTSAAVRLEGGQMALLLNNLILNRETSAPSLLQNGSFTFSDKSCYNVMGTVSATAYGNYTGDQKGKTSANLGSWAWNATNRVYTWDGKVSGTAGGTAVAVTTPAIDYTTKSDNISKAFDEGFMFNYSQKDDIKFNVTQNNIGQKLRESWGSGSYYKDQLDSERTYNGHYPGAYTKK